MRAPAVFLIAATAALCRPPIAVAQPPAPSPPDGLVYTMPGVSDVRVQRDLEYQAGRRYDVYRPGRHSATALPVVIFVTGAPDARQWNIYRSWARLTAASGLAAIVFDGTRETSRADFDALYAAVRIRGADLGLDADRVVVWAASGNATLGWPLATDPARPCIRAAAIYYGAAEVSRFRPDVPILLVRAGLDSPAGNRNIDALIAKALAANAPLTVISHPIGHHPFEETDADEYSRETIEATLAFMTRAARPAMGQALQAGADESFAASALYRQDWAAALRGYDRLAAAHPADPMAQQRLAEASLGAKDYRRGLAAYERSTALGNGRRGEIGSGAAKAAAALGEDPAFDAVRADPRFQAFLGKR